MQISDYKVYCSYDDKTHVCDTYVSNNYSLISDECLCVPEILYEKI